MMISRGSFIVSHLLIKPKYLCGWQKYTVAAPETHSMEHLFSLLSHQNNSASADKGQKSEGKHFYFFVQTVATWAVSDVMM